MKKIKSAILNNSSGQAIILTTVMLGGLMLSATAIAGLLMFYQLRQANDAAGSAMAVFAADAGLEAGSYCYFYGSDPIPSPPLPNNSYCIVNSNSSDFSNGVKYSSSLKFSFSGGEVTGFVQDSFGFSGQTERALQNVFSNQL